MNKFMAVLVAGSLVGCGGAPAKSPSASEGPPSPVSQYASGQTKMAETPDTLSTAPTSAAPAPPARAPMSDAKGERSDDKPPSAIGSAVSEFERAATTVRGARDGSPDCKGACRSLLSMERAASHLCALTRGTRDDYRCTDAENRVRDERKYVKSACGSCPVGQSLDPNAPLPPP